MDPPVWGIGEIAPFAVLYLSFGQYCQIRLEMW